MRFGSFDPAELNVPPWGELSMEFDDCNTATLSWSTASSEFDSGSLPFVRLTDLDRSECTLLPPGRVQPRAYVMTTETRHLVNGNLAFSASGFAALDADGSLWAVETIGASTDLILGPTNVSAPHHALTGKPLSGAEDIDRLLLRRGGNTWASPPDGLVIVPTVDESVHNTDGGLELNFIVPNASSIEWRLDPVPSGLEAPISMPRIAGQYVQQLKGQFFDSEATIDLGVDRSVCIKIELINTALPCDLDGEVWIVDGDDGFFDIELRNRRSPAEKAYRGRGWLQNTSDGERLVIVASNGDRQLGIAAAVAEE
jgi:hypothetical protein